MTAELDRRRFSGWLSDNLHQFSFWQFQLDDTTRKYLVRLIKKVHQPGRNLFDYDLTELDLGPAHSIIEQATKETMLGGGFVIINDLPHEHLTDEEFGLLNWAIGLNIGIPRPQGKASSYMAKVQDVGTEYRAAGGRGFSSNAELTFHTDGADISTLGCLRTAKTGGMSMVTSSLAAWHQLAHERPDLAEVATSQLCYFSRQQEEAEDEGPYYGQKLFEECEGLMFGKWNWNRIRTAQNILGVPEITKEQKETMDLLDDIIKRPSHLFSMYLKPGDLQIMNNNTVFHSRTAYEDYTELKNKRLLYRLWIAPPKSPRLPDSWRDFYRTVEADAVRGGIRGHNYNDKCESFDRKLACVLGMTY